MTEDPYIARATAAIEAACEAIVEARSRRRWMTVEEVAREVRLSPSRVAELLPRWSLPIAQGGFGLVVRRHPGQGTRRRWLICRHALDRMIERHWR